MNEEVALKWLKVALKTELSKAGVTYVDLLARLHANGVDETEGGLRNKLSRGTFSALFMCQCLAAIGVKSFTIDLVEYVDSHPELAMTSGYPYADADGRRYRLSTLRSPASRNGGSYNYEFMGFNRGWRVSEARMRQLLDEGRIIQTTPHSEPRLKSYQDEANYRRGASRRVPAKRGEDEDETSDDPGR